MPNPDSVSAYSLQARVTAWVREYYLHRHVRSTRAGGSDSPALLNDQLCAVQTGQPEDGGAAHNEPSTRDLRADVGHGARSAAREPGRLAAWWLPGVGPGTCSLIGRLRRCRRQRYRCRAGPKDTLARNGRDGSADQAFCLAVHRVVGAGVALRAPAVSAALAWSRPNIAPPVLTRLCSPQPRIGRQWIALRQQAITSPPRLIRSGSRRTPGSAGGGRCSTRRPRNCPPRGTTPS